MGLTCCAIAHTKPASSRAIATTILLRLTRRAASRRKRAHSRPCAFQAMSSAALGTSYPSHLPELVEAIRDLLRVRAQRISRQNHIAGVRVRPSNA